MHVPNMIWCRLCAVGCSFGFVLPVGATNPIYALAETGAIHVDAVHQNAVQVIVRRRYANPRGVEFEFPEREVTWIRIQESRGGSFAITIDTVAVHTVHAIQTLALAQVWRGRIDVAR